MLLSFQINKEDPRPIYEQLAAHVILLCCSGVLHPGDRLPPERDLAAQLNISRGTVKKAMETLKYQGYLESFQGSGNYVTAPKRQQEAPAESDGRVREICERAYSELRSLRIPLPQLFSMVRGYLEQAERQSPQVRLALIDCAPETLHCCHSQLEQLSYLKVETFVLQELAQDASLQARAEGCDLIFTTTTHFEQVRELLPACTDRLYSFALAVSTDTVVQLATLAPEARCAVICQTPRFYEIICRALGTIAPNILPPVCLLEREDGVLPERVPAEVDVLILYTNSCFLTDVRFSAVRDIFRRRGGRVVEFFYEMDQGSRMLVSAVSERIYRQKIDSEKGVVHSDEMAGR